MDMGTSWCDVSVIVLSGVGAMSALGTGAPMTMSIHECS